MSTLKSFDLQERQYQIQDAFYSLYPIEQPAMPAPMPTMDIKEYFDDFVIVCESGSDYKVSYTVDAAGVVTFAPRNEWQKAMEITSWTTVKAMEDWQLMVLGVPFYGPNGGKDRVKEYFDIKSQIHQDQYPEIPVTYFHTIDINTGRPTGEPVYIGKAIYDHLDSRGHWYKVILDKTKAMAARVWDAAKKGIAAASSETLGHLRRVAADGHIDNWPVAGMAVLDVAGGKVPVNSYAVATPYMKAIYRDAGIKFPEIKSDAVLSEAQRATERARRIAETNEFLKCLSH